MSTGKQEEHHEPTGAAGARARRAVIMVAASIVLCIGLLIVLVLGLVMFTGAGLEKKRQQDLAASTCLAPEVAAGVAGDPCCHLRGQTGARGQILLSLLLQAGAGEHDQAQHQHDEQSDAEDDRGGDHDHRPARSCPCGTGWLVVLFLLTRAHGCSWCSRSRMRRVASEDCCRGRGP